MPKVYQMLSAIWYHFCDLKNVKHTRGGISLSVTFYFSELKAYFTKSNTPPWVFFKFLELHKWYQIAQCIL